MVEKFFIKAQNDNVIGAELRKVMEDESITDKKQTIIDLAKKYGFEFTVEDIKNYSAKLKEQGDELSDDELEAVAGGSKSGARDFGNAFKNTLISLASSLGGCFADL